MGLRLCIPLTLRRKDPIILEHASVLGLILTGKASFKLQTSDSVYLVLSLERFARWEMRVYSAVSL